MVMSKKQRAISTVLTTMIILVASVVLGTGVVVYGTSLFQTGAQQQAMSAQGVATWVNATDSNGVSWGAAAVRNTGDKLVSIDTIIARGATIPFSSWYVDSDQTRVSPENFQSQMPMNGTDVNGLVKDSILTGSSVTTTCTTPDATTIEYDFDGSSGTKPTLCLLQASGPIGLNPGERMIVYFRMTDGLYTSVDTGSSTSISIFAGQVGAPTSVTMGSM